MSGNQININNQYGSGDLYGDVELLEKIIEREVRRANREYAEKATSRAFRHFNEVVYDRLVEYGIDSAKDEIKKLINKIIEECLKNENEANSQRK